MRCSSVARRRQTQPRPTQVMKERASRLDVLLQADAVDMFESLAPRQPGDRGACREYKIGVKWNNLAKSLA